MIPVKEIYDVVTKDRVVTPQNGDLSFDQFNRNSPLAELRLLDWLTGDVAGYQPPQPYSTQKVKDWASFLIESYLVNVQDGVLKLPENYYLYESMISINSSLQLDCVTELPVLKKQSDKPIHLLDTQVYDSRVNSYVRRLKPSMDNLFAKEVGRTYEMCVSDVGGVRLLYYRYPKYANIVITEDPVYKNEIINEAASTNYEWPAYARELLIWFIVDTFTIGTREEALKKQNSATGKLARP